MGLRSGDIKTLKTNCEKSCSDKLAITAPLLKIASERKNSVYWSLLPTVAIMAHGFERFVNGSIPAEDVYFRDYENPNYMDACPYTFFSDQSTNSCYLVGVTESGIKGWVLQGQGDELHTLIEAGKRFRKSQSEESLQLICSHFLQRAGLFSVDLDRDTMIWEGWNSKIEIPLHDKATGRLGKIDSNQKKVTGGLEGFTQRKDLEIIIEVKRVLDTGRSVTGELLLKQPSEILQISRILAKAIDNENGSSPVTVEHGPLRDDGVRTVSISQGSNEKLVLTFNLKDRQRAILQLDDSVEIEIDRINKHYSLSREKLT